MYVIIKVFMYFISLVTSFLRYICKIFLSFYGFNKIIFIIQYSSDIPLFSMCTAFISKDKLCTLLLEMLSKFTLSYYGPSKNITTNIDAQNWPHCNVQKGHRIYDIVFIVECKYIFSRMFIFDRWFTERSIRTNLNLSLTKTFRNIQCIWISLDSIMHILFWVRMK